MRHKPFNSMSIQSVSVTWTSAKTTLVFHMFIVIPIYVVVIIQMFIHAQKFEYMCLKNAMFIDVFYYVINRKNNL